MSKTKEKEITSTLRLDLDYPLNFNNKVTETVVEDDGSTKVIQRDPTEKEIKDHKAELSKMYIEFAVTASYKTGLNSQYRRLYAGLEKKIDDSIKDETYVIDVEPSEAKFMKDAFSNPETHFDVKISKYVVQLEDAILGL